MKKIIFLLVIVTSVFLCFFINIKSPNVGTVVLENSSSEKIEKFEMEVCDQKFFYRGLNVGEKSVFTYKVNADSEYKVEVVFASGKGIVSSIGYVTNGTDFEDRIMIANDGIKLVAIDP